MLEVSPSVSRRARFGAFLYRALAWPARAAAARRNLALLSQMSDRELGDIGLLRSDLYACAALPRDEDPTLRLAAARSARAWFARRRDGVFDGPFEAAIALPARDADGCEGGTELVRA